MANDSNTITKLTREFFTRYGFKERLGTYILSIPNNMVNSKCEIVGHVLPNRCIAYYQVNGIGASESFYTEEEVIALREAIKWK